MKRLRQWFPGRRARWVVCITLAVLAVGVALLAHEMNFRYRWGTEALAELEPRYARLEGLKSVSHDVELSLLVVSEYLARRTYPPDMPGDRVGTDFQQRMRALAESSGMSVAGSQILPAKVGSGFQAIPISARLEGTPESLRQLLVALPGEVPSVHVDSLLVQPARRIIGRGAGQQQAEQRLAVQLNLSVVQLLP
ncbi:MAG: type II secretion system protein GspM [Burkholderiaceae bacterium]